MAQASNEAQASGGVEAVILFADPRAELDHGSASRVAQ